MSTWTAGEVHAYGKDFTWAAFFFGIAVGSISEDPFCCEGRECGGYGSDSEGQILYF